MLFKEFAENVAKLLEERPELGELQVITSDDDEGNSYSNVNFTPTVGLYDDGFIEETSEDFLNDALTPNVVCLN